jgi:hypothetical protein
MDFMAHLQARALEVLARCERVIIPATAAEKSSLCYCGHPAEVRVSMRENGVEMFWGLACASHQDETVEVSVTGW